jgi:hypothetical protein
MEKGELWWMSSSSGRQSTRYSQFVAYFPAPPQLCSALLVPSSAALAACVGPGGSAHQLSRPSRSLRSLGNPLNSFDISRSIRTARNTIPPIGRTRFLRAASAWALTDFAQYLDDVICIKALPRGVREHRRLISWPLI